MCENQLRQSYKGSRENWEGSELADSDGVRRRATGAWVGMQGAPGVIQGVLKA